MYRWTRRTVVVSMPVAIRGSASSPASASPWVRMSALATTSMPSPSRAIAAAASRSAAVPADGCTLHGDAVALDVALEHVRPLRARDQVSLVDSQFGDLVQQPPEQRGPLPSERRRWAAVARGSGREQDRRAH